MPTITIHSIKHQNILSDENYAYILHNIGKPLELFNLSFYKNELMYVTVKGPNYAVDNATQGVCVVLFIDSNAVSYTLDLTGLEITCMHDTTCSNCCREFVSKHRLGDDKEPTMSLLCDECRGKAYGHEDNSL